VLTGLLARSGYSTGARTQVKEDYDTFENSELVKLNLSLFEAVGYTGNYMTEFSPELLVRMDGLHLRIDNSPYVNFVAKCNGDRPWVWKDPRLWVTIRYWRNLVNFGQCRFLLLRRSLFQCWISGLLRRQIRSYKDSRAYELNVQNSIRDFVTDSGARWLDLSYDSLIAHPEETIHNLNEFLNADIKIADLEKLYHKPLRKAPTASAMNTAKALAIYAKNYSERTDALSRRASSRSSKPAAGARATVP
jgi:hypothetical protein